MDAEKIQTKKELRSLGRYNKCKDIVTKKIEGNHINPQKLKGATSKAYYSIDAIEAIACSANHTLFSNNPSEVRLWSQKLRNLSVQNSAVGDVAFASYSGIDDYFVVKTPKTQDESSSVIHEAFVGMMGTNQLRDYIPNFAYVYGLLSCSGGIESSEGNTWCSITAAKELQLSVGAVYENINNSSSFYQAMNEVDDEELASIIVQIVMALIMANERIGFVHGDMHGNNVLIRKSSQMMTTMYTVSGVNYYVHSTYIPVIIDYGLSHIKYEGEDYGVYDFDHIGIKHNASSIATDIYRVLFSVKHVREVSSPFVDMLISYFDVKEMDPKKDKNAPFTYMYNTSKNLDDLEDMVNVKAFFINAFEPYLKQRDDFSGFLTNCDEGCDTKQEIYDSLIVPTNTREKEAIINSFSAKINTLWKYISDTYNLVYEKADPSNISRLWVDEMIRHEIFVDDMGMYKDDMNVCVVLLDTISSLVQYSKDIGSKAYQSRKDALLNIYDTVHMITDKIYDLASAVFDTLPKADIEVNTELFTDMTNSKSIINIYPSKTLKLL